MTALVVRWNLNDVPLAPGVLAAAAHVLVGYGALGEVWQPSGAALGLAVCCGLPWLGRRSIGGLARLGVDVLAADARLDDRDSLTRALGLDAATTDDATVLLAACQRWGLAALPRLIGDWALAWWQPATQTLVLARDAVGARPLYYAHQLGRALTLATDIRAIHTFLDVSRALDWAEVGDYLLQPMGFDTTHTFYADVRALPPGHALLVTPHGARLHAWWGWRTAPATPQPRRATPQQIVEAARALVVQATRDRLADVPTAAHLSGGLDSSAVAVLTHRARRDHGLTGLVAGYSWAASHADLPPQPADERPLIHAVAAAEGLSVVYAPATLAVHQAFHAWPLPDRTRTNLVAERAVQADAAARGIRLIASGWGGDEALTFGARGLPLDLLRQARLTTLARLLKRHTRLRPRPVARWLWAELAAPLWHDQALRHAGAPPGSVPLAAPGLAARVRPLFPPRPAPIGRGVHDTMRRLWAHGHIPGRMAGWARWGADHSVHTVYPLADRRVVQFMLGVPPHLMWHNGTARWLSRAALDPFLPQAVAWRRGKYDGATETQRHAMRQALWQEWAAEVRAGAWDDADACPLLDAPAMRALALRVPPPTHQDEHTVLRYVSLMAAVEVLALWRSQPAGARPANLHDFHAQNTLL